MYRYKDGTFKVTLPSVVIYDGCRYPINSLTRDQLDEIGYNEAVPIKREPFTSYETRWEKGADLIYREVVVTAVVDEAAKAEAEKQQRISEIKQELDQIDLKSVRPVRAIQAGTGTVDDTAYLSQLESEAQVLRTELAGMV